MYEQDYVMRMIHEMVRMLIKLLFNQDTEHNFSRQEIADGLKYMADLYGYGEIVEMLRE